jgi:hypothetical protein
MRTLSIVAAVAVAAAQTGGPILRLNRCTGSAYQTFKLGPAATPNLSYLNPSQNNQQYCWDIEDFSTVSVKCFTESGGRPQFNLTNLHILLMNDAFAECFGDGLLLALR